MEPNAVKILNLDSGLVVRIVEDGGVVDQTFVNFDHARAYAEGQRIRLKLLRYESLLDQEDA